MGSRIVDGVMLSFFAYVIVYMEICHYSSLFIKIFTLPIPVIYTFADHSIKLYAENFYAFISVRLPLNQLYLYFTINWLTVICATSVVIIKGYCIVKDFNSEMPDAVYLARKLSTSKLILISIFIFVLLILGVFF